MNKDRRIIYTVIIGSKFAGSYIYLERWKTEKYLRSQLNLG